MIKKFIVLALLTGVLLAACAPSAAPPPTAPTDPPVQVQEATPLPPAPVTEPPPAAPSEAPAAMPTSRGNALVATDPASVNLSSGQPQLVEFFAFW